MLFRRIVILLFYFNSIKVRLELHVRRLGLPPIHYFNSIKVRLELRSVRIAAAISPNFNSIKVRLEQEKEEVGDDYRIFQFHKGAIRTEGRTILDNSFLYFNSIKVRLELNYGKNCIYPSLISIP